MNYFSDYFKYYKITILILIVFIFIFLRVTYLESDIPITQLTEYAPIDESYYNHSGFNLYHYGSYTHQIVPYVVFKGNTQNILGNYMTYWGLKIWGNNYYGLRMPSVIAAILFIIFLCMFLRNLRLYKPPNNLENKIPYMTIFIILVLVYLTFDFSFLLAGRVAEPTIFRIMAMMFILLLMSYVASYRGRVPLYITFFIGFLSLSTVFFVYIYNLFVFFAVGMTLLIWAWSSDWKHIIRQFIAFILGSVLAILCYKCFCNIVCNTTLTEVIAGFMPFTYRMGVSSTGFIANPKHYLMNFTAIFSTNIFRFNSALLFVFLVSIPPFIVHVWKMKDRLGIIIANLLLFLILQCIVINDFNFRKLVILLPIVLLIILMAFTYQKEFIDLLRNNPFIKKMYYIYWILIGYFFVFFMQLGSITPKSLNTQIIMNPNAVIPANINRVNLAVFLFVFIIATMKYLGNKKIAAFLPTLAVLAMFLPGLYLDINYVYMHPAYTYKETMITMRDKVDNKVIAGGIAYGFRLYNDSIPILDFYSYSYSSYANPEAEYVKTMKRLFREKKADYTLRYHDDVSDEELFKERGIVLEKDYGIVSLYKPVQKELEDNYSDLIQSSSS